MRIDVRHDLHARGLQGRDRVRRGRLDEVDLPGHERGDAGRRFRHGQKHDAILLRDARLVPIVLVLHELQAFVRHHARELVRTRAHRVLGELIEVVARLFDRALRQHEEVGHVGFEEGLDRLRRERHLVLAGLFDFLDIVRARAGPTEVVGRKGRALVGYEPFEVPDGRVGVPFASIVELDALAKLKHPLLVVVRIDRPTRRESGLQRDFLVAGRKIPLDQRIVKSHADEAVAFESLVRLAAPVGNVGDGHGDAQNAFRMCGHGNDKRERDARRCGHHGHAHSDHGPPLTSRMKSTRHGRTLQWRCQATRQSKPTRPEFREATQTQGRSRYTPKQIVRRREVERRRARCRRLEFVRFFYLQSA